MLSKIYDTYDLRPMTYNLRIKRGFTLIELMLVVIIIGVLVAMVMPRLAGRSEQARIAAAKADIEANIALALDLFELDMGSYPTTEEGLASLRQYSGSEKEDWKGPYLKKMPKDPWGREYKYRCPGTHNNDYDLYSLGPNGMEGDDDDIKNWE